jgi:hypothetical protein
MEQAYRSRRRNRWSDEPVLDKNGNAVVLGERDLQTQDIQCLRLLARFRRTTTSSLLDISMPEIFLQDQLHLGPTARLL